MAFNFFKGTNTNNTPAAGTNSAAITLGKATESLDRHIINLKKDGTADLTNHKARVCVIMDRSGSMDHLYSSGAVQEVLTRLLPLANRFDDNRRAVQEAPGAVHPLAERDAHHLIISFPIGETFRL